MNRQEMMERNFNNERAAILSRTEFPYDWKEIKPYIHKAMIFTSCVKVALPLESYRKIINLDETLLMPEVTTLINILMGATPQEMGQTLIENYEWIDSMVIPIRNKWIEMDENISKPIANRINAQSAIIAPDGKRIYPSK